MRIALRTGGGRGVYELAGRQGDLAASDLFDHDISYELTPEIIIPGRSIASKRQGKPRITLVDETRKKTTHIYFLLSAVLLLPKPKREFKTTSGDELLQYESYSMTVIKVDIAGLTTRNVTLRPTDLLLENADGQQAKVDFTERMARVIRVWDAAKGQSSQLAQLVRNLAQAVVMPDPDYKIIEHCAQDIAELLNTTGDVLPLVEEGLGLRALDQEAQETHLIVSPGQIIRQTAFGLDDEISPQEAVVQRVKRWRQQAERGSAGRKFSRDVSTAYGFRCLFSGQRLPRLQITDSPGVDSAHILPWSTHDLNSVRNGLCLTKQCHWAFDQGIVRLSFDQGANSYILSVPDNIRRAASQAAFDLGSFESLTGAIPTDRLPTNQALWPSPTYLRELNNYLTTI